MDNASLVEAVWPFIRKANDQTAKHGRIGKELSIITHKGNPFARAAKETIQRVAANKLLLRRLVSFTDR